jgi:acetate kinase
MSSPGGGSLVLVLNAGSSSLKASLHAPDGESLWRQQRPWQPPAGIAATDPARLDGLLAAVLEPWLPEALAPWRQRLGLVGHRFVHGGEAFTGPTRLSTAVLAALQDLLPLAPLHHPPALAAIRWLARWQPALPQWACFDTAFHATLPEAAHTYALPASWRRQGLRRFGFHGLNHQHVSTAVQARLGAGRAHRLRLVSCHLGAGCSLCAIAGGRSIATTMGFTPLEGLVMASRSGSIDPGLLLHQWRRGLSLEEVERALQAESGLLGLSGLSGDMRDLRQAAAAGHPGAVLAIAVFRHQLLQGIGAMAASLGGVDAIALSGGIGEHDQALREELQAALAWLEPCHWLVIPADEEGQIARSCAAAAGLAA